jgi:uncharacterized membrane protein YjjP (DUF1212 family)
MGEPVGTEQLDVFVAEVGAAMIGAVAPMRFVRRSMAGMAQRMHLDASYLALPDAVMSLSNTGTTRHVVYVPPALRYDQTQTLYTLVGRILGEAEGSSDSLERLQSIRAMRPSFGRWANVVGYALMTFGLAVRLNPNLTDFAISCALGVLGAVLMVATPRLKSLRGLMPMLTAFVVAVPAFMLVEHGVVRDVVTVLVPVFAIFIPGPLLAIGSLDLSQGAIPVGSARLAAGLHALLLLAFALVIAGAITNLPSAAPVQLVPGAFGWWAALVGVGIYGWGIVLAYSALPRALPGFLLVLYAAWLGQTLGAVLIGGFASGFVGALVALLVAAVTHRWFDGPPELLTVSPLFRILAPGGLGLVGVTQITVGNFGAAQIGAVVFMFIAVALGLMVGIAAVEAWRTRLT